MEQLFKENLAKPFEQEIAITCNPTTVKKFTINFFRFLSSSLVHCPCWLRVSRVVAVDLGFLYTHFVSGHPGNDFSALSLIVVFILYNMLILITIINSVD